MNMKLIHGTKIDKPTLDFVQGVISETNADSCRNSLHAGVEALEVRVSDLSYAVVIDNDVITFILELSAPDSGYIHLANEWNMLETVGTAVCLTSGYVVKFGILTAGGVVRETVHDAVSRFNQAAVKFSSQAKSAHQ